MSCGKGYPDTYSCSLHRRFSSSSSIVLPDSIADRPSPLVPPELSVVEGYEFFPSRPRLTSSQYCLASDMWWCSTSPTSEDTAISGSKEAGGSALILNLFIEEVHWQLRSACSPCASIPLETLGNLSSPVGSAHTATTSGRKSVSIQEQFSLITTVGGICQISSLG